MEQKFMEKNSTLNDLKIAQQELIIHHQELEKCAKDLKKANADLDTGEIEKEKLADEVNTNLEGMMFTISHKIRKSVANILGVSKLLYVDETLGEIELREMLSIIIQSAESLNSSTEELAKFIHFKKEV
jgi:signal transduction histidine kinase